MIVRKLNNIKEQPAGHEDKKNPGCFKKVIFQKSDFPQGLSLQMFNWARIPKNRHFKLHYHQDMMEIFVLVKGTVRMTVGTKKIIVKKGSSVMVPEKTDHSMENIGLDEVEYFVIGLSGGRAGKTINKE